MLCPKRKKNPLLANPVYESDLAKDGSCLFCGSISPSELFTLVLSGVSLIPTDNSYEVSINDGDRRKFFFEHFSNSDIDRFIELYNNRTIQLTHPGYFYVLPFFMKTSSNERS